MRNGKIVVGLYEATTSAAVRALAGGFFIHGYDVEIRNAYHFKKREAESFFDIVVTHGLRTKFREVFDHYTELGVPVLVFDFGYLDRVNDIGDYHDKHWYIGLGGLGWRPEKDCDDLRLKKLSTKIDYSRRKPGKRIYICGQMPGDASHRMERPELGKYYGDLFNELKMKAQGEYEVVFRPHPRCLDFIPDRVAVAAAETLDECLLSAHAIVVHNSTIGVDSLLRGCPVICLGDASYKHLVNDMTNDLSDLKVPSESEVERFCRQLSYAQWTLEECSKGLPVQYLRDAGYIVGAG
jgi:hypothetical protein